VDRDGLHEIFEALEHCDELKSLKVYYCESGVDHEASHEIEKFLDHRKLKKARILGPGIDVTHRH
jgi:hypothetical protein